MEDEDFKIVNLYNNELKVFRDGRIESYYTLGAGYSNKKKLRKMHIETNGYTSISLKDKRILNHRIIGYTFLGLDIDNPKMYIDHIDRNRKNNNWLNLRIVTPQQNQFNYSNVKGYRFHKKRYEARIQVNGKGIYLGRYKKEEDARQAYLDAKKIYHKY